MAFAKVGRLALQFSALFAFWLILSGKLEPVYLFFGVISAALVTFVTQDLVADLLASDGDGQSAKGSRGIFYLKGAGNFVLYFIWLIYAILQANFQVALVVLHPKLPIDPGMLRFQTRLQNQIGHVILANSITLTPGTITLNFSEGSYLVHTLIPQAAASLFDAKMQTKLQTIFGEPEETPSEVQWVEEDS
jgi:multicomponent Na+:H+ antiporter subunit E